MELKENKCPAHNQSRFSTVGGISDSRWSCLWLNWHLFHWEKKIEIQMKDSFCLPLERTVLHPLFWRFRGRKNRAIFSSSQGLFSEALWSYLGRDWCYWLVRRKKKKQHKGSSEWPRPVFGLCQSPMGNYSRQYFFSGPKRPRAHCKISRCLPSNKGFDANANL